MLFIKSLWALVPDNIRILAVVIGLVSLCGWFHHAGAVSVQAKWDKAIADAAIAVLEKERNQQLITNGVSNGFQSDIAAINTIFDSMPGSPNSRDLPSIPNAACGLNGQSGNYGLSQQMRKQAEIQAANLIRLRQWVRMQQAASVTGN